MRKSFITGLMLILPLVITLILVYFIFNVITKPFVSPIEDFLIANDVYGYAQNHQFYLPWVLRVVVLIFLFALTTFVGVLANVYWMHFLGKIGESVIDHIPVVNKIYRAARDVVKIILGSADTEIKFGKVVMVPFPTKEMRTMGFISNEAMAEGSDREHMGLVSVLVPGSPNPTMGFLLMFPREEIEYLDIKVEDGLKFIISLGVVVDEKSFLQK